MQTLSKAFDLCAVVFVRPSALAHWELFEFRKAALIWRAKSSTFGASLEEDFRSAIVERMNLRSSSTTRAPQEAVNRRGMFHAETQQ